MNMQVSTLLQSPMMQSLREMQVVDQAVGLVQTELRCLQLGFSYGAQAYVCVLPHRFSEEHSCVTAFYLLTTGMGCFLRSVMVHMCEIMTDFSLTLQR